MAFFVVVFSQSAADAESNLSFLKGSGKHIWYEVTQEYYLEWVALGPIASEVCPTYQGRARIILLHWEYVGADELRESSVSCSITIRLGET